MSRAVSYTHLLAAASPEEVYEYIKSVSYPNNKTRSLIGAAKVLVEEFGGEMPSDIDNLMKLPGVGRKTANVMLSVVWNKAAMAVDTHVFRVSERIGPVSYTHLYFHLNCNLLRSNKPLECRCNFRKHLFRMSSYFSLQQLFLV